MSDAIVRRGGLGFQQSGQLDWVSLSKSSVSFGFDVLVRLSKADLAPATVAIAQFTCSRFVISAEAQKRIFDALSKLKSFSSYGKFVWFGFGVKSVIKDLTDSEYGTTCVALCACMSVSYDSFFAAGVFRELCKISGAPSNVLPSIHQWKELVEICTGSLSYSKFPVLLEGLIRSVHSNADISLQKHTSTEALAKAIGALADVTNGKLDNVSISGGLDCIWLAAIAEWLMSLNVEIRLSTGETVYRSSSIDGFWYPKVTIFFNAPQNNIQPIHLSKCYIIPDGLKLGDSSSPEQFRGGRSEWPSILTDAFGSCFDSLNKDSRQDFALFLFRISCLSEDCYRYGSVQSSTWQNPALYTSGIFHRFHFVHPASRGETFLEFAAKQLPEMGETLEVANQLGIKGRIHTPLEDCISNIILQCTCQLCSEDKAHSCEPFCLVIIAETIIMLLWMLSAAEVDLHLKPSACGIRLLYMRQRRKYNYAKGSQMQQGRLRRENYPLSEIFQSDIDVLSAAITVFTGSDDATHLEDGELSAVSRHGVCAFFKGLKDINIPPEEASTVKVVAGHINFEGTNYSRICDLTEVDMVPTGGFEPNPTYDLLVKETRQPGVIAAAYKFSSNRGLYRYLLGVARLQVAITTSVRGPMECTEICGQGLCNSNQNTPRFKSVHTIHREKGSELFGRPSPFHCQWSLLSTPSTWSDKGVKLRIVQAEIHRLYLEITQDRSCQLAFLGNCQFCACTPSDVAKFEDTVTSPFLGTENLRQDGAEGNFVVYAPSEMGSWMASEFEIPFYHRESYNEEKVSAADMQHAAWSLRIDSQTKRTIIEAALESAVFLGCEGIVQLLLQGGIDVDLQRSKGKTMLHFAAESGQNEVVKILLGRGAHIDKRDEEGLDALARAARNECESTISMMIGYGANFESCDGYGFTPLLWAATQGRLEVIEKLLEWEAFMNNAAGISRRREAFQAAAGAGQLSVMERLTQEKVDLETAAAQYKGRTALQIAAEGGHFEVVDWLIQNNVDVNAVGSDGQTALLAAASGGYLEIAETLLQANANVNALDSDGRTALILAVDKGYSEVVELLLRANIDIRIAGSDGRTATQIAEKHPEMAKLLEQTQAKANADPSRSPKWSLSWGGTATHLGKFGF